MNVSRLNVGAAQTIREGPENMLSRIRRSMADKDQGFTLIELLVVIIIIGILAAIAIPVFLNQRRKSVDASLKSDLHNAAIIMETWTVDNPGATRVLDAATSEFNTPSTVHGVLTGLKISRGNAVVLLPSITPVGGYCLYASNPASSKANGATCWLVWRSILGGLDPALSTVGGSDCA